MSESAVIAVGAPVAGSEVGAGAKGRTRAGSGLRAAAAEVAQAVAARMVAGPLSIEQRRTHSGQVARVPVVGAWFVSGAEVVALLRAADPEGACAVPPAAARVVCEVGFYRSFLQGARPHGAQGMGLLEMLIAGARSGQGPAELEALLAERLAAAAQKAVAPAPLPLLAGRIAAALCGAPAGPLDERRRRALVPTPEEAAVVLSSVRGAAGASEGARPADVRDEKGQQFLLFALESLARWEQLRTALVAVASDPGQQAEALRARVSLCDAVYRDLRNAAWEVHRRREARVLTFGGGDDGEGADALSLALDTAASESGPSPLWACLRDDRLEAALRLLFTNWKLDFLLVLEQLVEGDVDVQAWISTLRAAGATPSPTAIEVRLTRARQRALYRFFCLYFDLPAQLRSRAAGLRAQAVRAWELAFLSPLEGKRQAVSQARRELGLRSEQEVRDLRDEASRYTLERLEEELGDAFSEVETAFRFLLFGEESSSARTEEN
jgi:hypothetical protein